VNVPAYLGINIIKGMTPYLLQALATALQDRDLRRRIRLAA
jgi:hypothetical protein